jgi:DNA-binding NarL/FixJ family response regulator
MTATTRPTVLVADDHLVVLEGLAATLSRDFTVVGQVSRLDQLAPVIEDTRPQVAVVDLVFERESVLPLLKSLCAQATDTRFVVLTAHTSPALAQAAFDAGATGFVLKGAGYQELRLAIDAALEGRRFTSGSEKQVPVAREGSHFLLDGIPVTGQQVRILCLLLEDGARTKVAARLGLTVRGVDHHLDQLRRRLGLASIILLARWASDNAQELYSIAQLLPANSENSKQG